MLREIVTIDEELCDGCGLCVPACEEGAIRVVDGKARLVASRLCDGLGACLGHCPRGAIRIERHEAEPFSEAAVREHLRGGETVRTPQSELRQWPAQLRLLSPHAPFLRGARLLLSADCVPFAYPAFHASLLRDHALAIACPKLDDPEGYVEKLAMMIVANGLAEIAVARMEVPCCLGLLRLALEARRRAGVPVPIVDLEFSLQGDLLNRREIGSDPALEAEAAPSAPGG